MNKRNTTMVMTLCRTCYNNFCLLPGREVLLIQRQILDSCCYCGVRNGFDYLIENIGVREYEH
jgi:hypothetical protein